jgi:hypothetical protein
MAASARAGADPGAVPRAQGIIAARGQPDADAEAKDLNAEVTETRDRALDDAADKLKRSAFMNRRPKVRAPPASTPGDGQEPTRPTASRPRAELAKQTTRRVVQDAKAGATSGASKAA